MEMPRDEMEMVDAAGAFRMSARSTRGPSRTMTATTIRGTTGRSKMSRLEPEGHGDIGPAIGVAAAAITTAAALERSSADMSNSSVADGPSALPRVSPDVFKQGMTVTHPEYGPGKIVALSGAGKNRRATIQFATVGQKKIILAHSAVRPAR